MARAASFAQRGKAFAGRNNELEGFFKLGNRQRKASALCIALCICLAGLAPAGLALARDVVLGNSPTREDAADSCDMLLIQDAATGEVLLEKEARRVYTISGMPVLWMCALTALDYLELSDEIESEVRDFGLPAGTQALGVKRGQTYTVRDLVAAMALTGAADAAILLRNAAMEAAGAAGAITLTAEPTPSGGRVDAQADKNYRNFYILMDQKAAALGMTGTHYVNAWGLEDAAQVSTARDQMLLLRAIMENKALFRVLRMEQYTMESENRGVDAVLRQSAPLMDAKGSAVDKRVKAFAGGSDDTGAQCVVYGQTDVRDIVAVLWAANATDTESEGFCSQLLDQYAAIDVIDILPDVARCARNLTLRYEGGAISNWAVDADALLFDAFSGFAVEADKLTLTPDESTVYTKADGNTELIATIFYDGVELGGVRLTTDRSVKGGRLGIGDLPIYTEAGQTEPPTWLEEYGWAFLIGGAALLGIAVYILARVIRDRIEY